MKKIYMQPQLTVTNIQPTSSLMVVSTRYLLMDSSEPKITTNDQILVKRNYVDYNVWDDDWSN